MRSLTVSIGELTFCIKLYCTSHCVTSPSHCTAWKWNKRNVARKPIKAFYVSSNDIARFLLFVKRVRLSSSWIPNCKTRRRIFVFSMLECTWKTLLEEGKNFRMGNESFVFLSQSFSSPTATKGSSAKSLFYVVSSITIFPARDLELPWSVLVSFCSGPKRTF